MTIDIFGTLVAASLVLLLGQQLVSRIGTLRTYTIPEPVAGGLLIELALAALRGLAHTEVRFDTSMQTPLMLTFFASIGLNANCRTSSPAARCCCASCSSCSAC